MSSRKNTHPGISLVAGGTAGLFEALCCHPLDTIKVRMQIHRRQNVGSGVREPGFIRTGHMVYTEEGFLALYKGLGAVVIGIIPKMAIRFSSYEFYRKLLTDPETGKITTANTFLSGVGAGVTEAVMVVNPMEVVKIRLQAQHLVKAPAPASATASATASTVAAAAVNGSVPMSRYNNAVHCGYTIIKEEGFATLYRGVSLTAARQATNQGANFTVYSKLKEYLQNSQNLTVLPSWQTSFIGLISGAVGPFSNAPLDTIKTRLQKDRSLPKNMSNLKAMSIIAKQMVKEEGFRALYKGITPRVMRVAPGQAVTFTIYELVSKRLENSGIFKKNTP